jgi:hypothetical protein
MLNCSGGVASVNVIIEVSDLRPEMFSYAAVTINLGPAGLSVELSERRKAEKNWGMSAVEKAQMTVVHWKPPIGWPLIYRSMRVDRRCLNRRELDLRERLPDS